MDGTGDDGLSGLTVYVDEVTGHVIDQQEHVTRGVADRDATGRLPTCPTPPSRIAHSP